MRLLFLTPGCFDKGGISRYSRYQIEALRQILGTESVRVLSLLGPGEDSFEAPFAVDWHGPSAGRPSLMDRAAFSARAAAIAAAWRPHVVHAAHVNFGPLVTRVARLCGGQTLLNVYGLEIWSGLSPARRQHMATMDEVISDCHFTAEYVIEDRLHATAPTVIWDPVDLERFSPAPAPAAVLAKYGVPDPQRHKMVLSLGRLAKAASHKGFDRLIEVVAGIAGDLPELRLVIAGRGDDRARLEAICSAQSISDRVVFTGAVDEADLPDLYRCAHVFSLVSDRGHGRGEGIPLTPLEAMACGAPITVGDEDGSREAVVADRNGFVVSPRDPTAHALALRRLLTDSALQQRMAREARAVAQEHFSFNGFVAKHRQLLEELPRRGRLARAPRAT